MKGFQRGLLTRSETIIYVAAFLRAVATGMMGVLLGIYIARLNASLTELGYVITAGLGGCAVSSIVVTGFADRYGRRKSLVILSVLGVAGAGAILFASNTLMAGVAAFFGMLNGMGRDRSAAFLIEQAILPSTVTASQRTRTFAIYNILQDAGHALGSLFSGLPTLLESSLSVEDGFRWTFLVYIILIAATGLLYLRLSTSVESSSAAPSLSVTPETRSILWKISALFGLDGIAGGFLTTSLLSFFFFERFGVQEYSIGLLFFFARLANMGSHAGAAWLAGRIGLVNTMVFTHVPSSILLILIPFTPDFTIAGLIFLLRESMVEMDVPTRQSYVMAVVKPEERMTASGVTNIVRLVSWAISPAIAGHLMQGVSIATPLFAGASLKIAYDLMLYRAFHKIKPPEELKGD